MIELKCLRLTSPPVAQPHRNATPWRLRLGSAVLTLACCPMLAGASTDHIAQCGQDVKPVIAGTADFNPSELCNERTSFTGVVSLSIVVSSDGNLKSARIVSSTITPSMSTPCAEFQSMKFAKLLRFTAPPSICRMIFPMKFKVSGPDIGDKN
jgi:hypothetical protein